MNEIEKLKKEIEDLKLIIESKNNQVESKNKHIKRLERIISNIKKRKILIEHDSGRQSRPYKSANKADLSLLLGTSQNPRQYRRLGGSNWVSTQRQKHSPIPPSDYKLPSGEQAVRTEPSRMGGDKIKKAKKGPLKGLVCNRLPYQPIHQVPYHLIS